MTLFRGLWQNPNFIKFWSARTISWLGSHVSFLALPLIAVILLEATPLEMGILSAAQTLPYLLFSLFIGAWVDRLKRRPLLIIADVGRGLLIFGIPILALSNTLSIEILILLAFVINILTVLADVAEEAYLPILVGREQLIEGHSKLSATSSAAEMVGPGLGGALVQWFSAPIAIAFDGLSFLISGILLLMIRTKESAPIRETKDEKILSEIIQGLRFTIRHDILRPTIATALTLQLFGGMKQAILFLYITNDLEFPPIFIGLIYATGSLSGLLIAIVSERVIDRIGIGRVFIIAAIMIGIGWMVFPLAGATLTMPLMPILMGMLIAGIGNTLFNITIRSLTQMVTPDHFLGRVNSTGLFLGMGALPIGALVGGMIGTSLGTQVTFLLASSCSLFAWLWVFFSPLRHKQFTLPDMQSNANLDTR